MSGTEPAKPVLHLVRITIETASPLSVGSGDDVEFKRRPSKDDPDKTPRDARVTGLMRDANGLPTIGGASLQGVLRRLSGTLDGFVAADIFGCDEEEKEQAARLHVSFGALHDADDRAVTGAIDVGHVSDFLKSFLPARPTPRDYRACEANGDAAVARPGAPSAIFFRDHVKLNERHVADGHKKFERLAVPIGTRFSFELAMWGDVNKSIYDAGSLQALVSLICHPEFRLGGGARRGYGKVTLVRASHRAIDPGETSRLRTIRQEPPSTSLTGHGGTDWSDVPAPSHRGAIIAKLTLEPVNPWRIGGATPSMTECGFGSRLPDGSAPKPQIVGQGTINRRGVANADGTIEPRNAADIMTIAREPRVIWNGGNAMLVEPGPRGPFDFIVPGSALKGPLWHRALFHWNRLAGSARMIDVAGWPTAPEERKAKLKALAELPEKLEQLFGCAKQSATDGNKEDGRAARVLFDDGEVRDVRAVQAIDHISIDRFTGGVRPRFLFVEEVLVGGRVVAAITILPPIDADGNPSGAWAEDVRAAFCHGLRDLCSGRLAIGAKSLGFCRGDVQWSGDGAAAWTTTWDAAAARAGGAQGATA